MNVFLGWLGLLVLLLILGLKCSFRICHCFGNNRDFTQALQQCRGDFNTRLVWFSGLSYSEKSVICLFFYSYGIC